MRPLTTPQVLLFALALAVALVVALFPLYPGQLRVAEGNVAARTIRSPRAATFESDVLTQRAMEDAGRAVPDVQVYDPTVRDEQLAKLAAATVSIAEVRDNASLDDAAKRARLLSVENLSGVSRGSIDAVLALPPDRWPAVVTEAEQALAGAVGQSVAPEGIQAAQDGLRNQISPDLSGDEANFVAELVRPLIVPTLVVDQAATEQARETATQNVQPVQVTIAENQEIVAANQPIDATTVEVLEEVGLLTPRVEWQRLLAVVIIAALVAASLALYVALFPTRGITSERNLLLLALLIAAPALIAKVYFSLVLPEEPQRFLAYLLPLAAAPMLIAALLEARLAIVIGFLQTGLAALAIIFLPDTSLVASIQPLDVGRVLAVYGLGGIVGVFAVHRAERANQYAAAGVLVGLVALAALFALWLIDTERRALDAVWMLNAAAINGAGAGLLTTGAISAVGALLGVTTRVQLMELGQLNAPLLRRLQDEAPGTFHHSVIVANLAERAADLVGADSLLARVGCYYHDIGKVLQPGFYIENQLAGDNPHDGLAPTASARVIAQHVKGGQELARRHGLPGRVRAFIPEHHGTRLVAYFYRVATQQDPDVDQTLFRYPGPKPQSRETAIVMLADSTEAMVRAQEDRSAERIDVIVEEVIAERVAEGELDDCDLTLRDIRTIAESFKQTLRGVYHPRIAYPEPTETERRALIGRFRPGRRAARPPATPAPLPPQGQRTP